MSVRVRSLTARMVPLIMAVSGMTLLVVPVWIWVTVMTPGSNTSMRLVTSVCSAWTISQATGTGSSVKCGALPWPPRPFTVMVIESLDAMMVPPFRPRKPPGMLDAAWMANAPVTGESVPTLSSPSASISLAPL